MRPDDYQAEVPEPFEPMGEHKLLEVRSRRVLTANGTLQRNASVLCPLWGHAVPIEECTSCARCSGLYINQAEQRTLLLCGYQPDEEPAVSTKPGNARWGDSCQPRRTSVAQVMGADVVCVRPDLSVEALAALLLERNISGVPVVDEEGKPVGVVSKTDLLRADYGGAGTKEPELARSRSSCCHEAECCPGIHAGHRAGTTVNDIMTPLVFALPESASLAQAAALMAYEGVHRVPVVSVAGQVVGLLSSLDVLRWLGKQSGYFVSETTQPQQDSQVASASGA